MTGSSSIAPIELPQIAQKARLDTFDDRKVWGLPPVPVHLTFSRENSTQSAVSAPVCCWQKRHEQV
jgi:hypothetical protein